MEAILNKVNSSDYVTVIPVTFGDVEYFQVYVYSEYAETYIPQGSPHKFWQDAYKDAERFI